MTEGPRMLFRFHRSTPFGEGGVAVFELYDPAATEALRAVFKPRGGALPDPGSLRLGDLVGRDGRSFDEAVVSRVPGECHWSRLSAWTLSFHGGLWLQRRVVDLLVGLGGVEASRRDLLIDAIRVGALDGIQAAAYELLLDARTEKAARFFARQHGGELSSALRDGVDLCEHRQLGAARALLARILEGASSAYRIGHPCRLLIAGRPNSGKSTLFNRLMEDERAAVTHVPGTTRDLIEGDVALGGFPVTFLDSAGFREQDEADEIEERGMRAALDADVDGVLLLVPYPWNETSTEQAIRDAFGARRCLTVSSLADLDDGTSSAAAELRLSCLSGQGLGALRAAIARRWLTTGDLDAEVPCAPFTAEMASGIREALNVELRPPSAELDAIREAIVEFLSKPWLDAFST